MNAQSIVRTTATVWVLALLFVRGADSGAQGLPSSIPRRDFWVPDGPVYAIAETNGVIYVGGAFSSFSTDESRTVLLDGVSGVKQAGFPLVDGVVRAAVPDGAGGWFLGGAFSGVGGLARANLARVRADLSVDPDWNPGANDAVLALAVAGETVYIGGLFTVVTGQPRRNLAALHAATGGALPWNPDVCCDINPQTRSRVTVLLVRDNQVYAGGSFGFVDGQPRSNLAAVDAVTGQALPWAEDPQDPSAFVSALALDGDLLYIGGRFQSMGAANRVNLAAVDAVTGFATSWSPPVNGDVLGLAISGDTLFVGGSFTSAGGQSRSRLAAIDRVSGLARAWNPAPNGTVQQVVAAGAAVYVAGSFTSAGGASRRGLAALEAASGRATAWNPSIPTDSIHCLAASGARVLAAGPTLRNSKPRSGLAALDARTGQVLDWNPDADQAVFTLALGPDVVYAGGDFLSIGSAPRTRVAAIDSATGLALEWGTVTNGPNGRVEAIAVSPSTVYAAGGFTAVGTVFSPGLTSLNRLTGQTNFWRPFANRPVRAVIAAEEAIYVAGSFSSIGTQSRSAVAALDSTTAGAYPWNPAAVGATATGWTLARSGDLLYVGGSFTDIGGASRLHLAALDIDTGVATAWNPAIPSLNDWVQRVSVAGDIVYAAGSFASIGGQPRHQLAALDAVTAEALPWNPDPRSPSGGLLVSAVEASGGAVYVGGSFHTMGGVRRPHFAVFSKEGAPQILRQPNDAVVSAGQPTLMTVEVSGEPPLAVQWQLNGTNLAGATSTNLLLANPQPADAGIYSVIVTNEVGLVQSSPVALTVTVPLSIVTQPTNRTVAPGNNVSLVVVATGSPAPMYQWKLNGAAIPGETSATLSLTNVQPSSSGRYSVLVFNGAETLESQMAALTVTVSALPFSDNFASRLSTNSASGSGFGSNVTATSESAQGEPDHAGKPGGRSVWYSWVAPASGIATFHTRGSDFDTLLAAYTFSFFGGLDLVDDDDDGGGFQTSHISFNAVAGTRYEIAVDGFAGRTGRIVMTWSLQTTTDTLPRILVPPASRTVAPGASHTLVVIADGPSSLSYQWRRNGVPIAGATNISLTLGNFQPASVGHYSVMVSSASRSMESDRATLELGATPEIVSQDKLEDLLFGDGASGRMITLSLGTNGAQVLNNYGASTQFGEPNPCGAPGGASRWLRLRPASAGTLVLDTTGSTIDTVLAVYTGTNSAALTPVACDNDGAPDGARSLVRFDAASGVDYLVAVDGFRGAQGEIRLNWRLGIVPFIAASPTTHVVKQGASLTFGVAPATAIPPPTYEWLLNGVLIPGSTGTSLTLTNLQPGQSGTYSIVARNPVGSVTNVVALVTVAAPITLNYELVLASGRPFFRVRGPVAAGALIEATTNFIHWVPLKTNTTSNLIDFLDPASTNLPARFYRVVPRP